MPPTSAASSTRGTRKSQRIDSWVASSGESTPGTPSLAATERSASPTPMWTGPATIPTTRATRRKATPAGADGPRRRGGRFQLLAPEPQQRGADRPHQIHETRPPPGGDRVVEPDDRPGAHRRDV